MKRPLINFTTEQLFRIFHSEHALFRSRLRECAIRNFIADNELTEEDFQTVHWLTLFKLAHAELIEVKK